MIPTRTTSCLLAALAAIGIAACSAKTPSHTPTTPTYDIRQPQTLPDNLSIPIIPGGDHLFVRASINGDHTGLFMLDTGSAINAVALGIANRLNLPPNGSTIVSGIAGRESIIFRRADSLSIGPVALDPARLAGLRTYRLSRDVPLAGIIGFVALRNTPFTIDYNTHTLTIHHPDRFEPPTGSTRSRLFLIGHLPGTRALLEPRYSIDLIIDSGADAALTLPAAVLARYPDILTNTPTGIGRSLGVGGTTANTLAWVKSITIFGQTLRNVPVTFEAPSSPTEQPTTVGRVGNQLLRHFNPTFDLPHHAIWTSWRPKN